MIRQPFPTSVVPHLFEGVGEGGPHRLRPSYSGHKFSSLATKRCTLGREEVDAVSLKSSVRSIELGFHEHRVGKIAYDKW